MSCRRTVATEHKDAMCLCHSVGRRLNTNVAPEVRTKSRMDYNLSAGIKQIPVLSLHLCGSRKLVSHKYTHIQAGMLPVYSTASY